MATLRQRRVGAGGADGVVDDNVLRRAAAKAAAVAITTTAEHKQTSSASPSSYWALASDAVSTIRPAEWLVFVLLTCVKLAFMHAYRSTDFEVHRNWLAITYSLPMREWYVDATSEWTLDYPPFFAWFEYVLAHIAARIAGDTNMLRVSNLNYASEATIVFQRCSVIVTDLLLFVAIHAFSRAYVDATSTTSTTSAAQPSASFFSSMHTSTLLMLCAFGCPGLLLVDHVHFQYNGVLLGVFVLSIACLYHERHDVLGAALFAVALNLKHIFLYVAPVYFVYLLAHYCIRCAATTTPTSSSTLSFSVATFVRRLLVLGTVVIAVFALSFGPFIAFGQLGQVLSRLFPFKRGLTHAYWAPNVWALYNFADWQLAAMARTFSTGAHQHRARNSGGDGGSGGAGSALRSSSTTGLVADVTHAVLPDVPPSATFVLTLLTMLPALWRLWRHPRPSMFLACLVFCSLSSFMLGWHVHEKAILMTLLPLTLLACQSVRDARIFLLLSWVGTYSLFPLLFRAQEEPLRCALFVVYHAVVYVALRSYHVARQAERRIRFTGFLRWEEVVYLALFVPLHLLTTYMLPIYFPNLSFLPLMITSVYCALGVTYVWYVTWRKSSCERLVRMCSRVLVIRQLMRLCTALSRAHTHSHRALTFESTRLCISRLDDE